MAGIQRDVLINYKGDASNLTAASQKAQDAIDEVSAAQSKAAEKAAKDAEKAAAAQEKAAQKAADAQAREAEKAAAAQVKAAERAAREAEALADAQERAAERLKDIASEASDLDRVTRAFEKQKAEIEALAELTGDQEAAQKALTVASAKYEAQVKDIQDAQEQAAKAAADAQEEAANAANDAADEQEAASERAADGFGKVGESAGKLGGALEMAGLEGAQAVADLADVGEVAAEALGAMSGAAGLATAAVVALGAGYAIAVRDVSRINAQFELQAELATEVRDAQYGLEDALQAQALASGKLNEAQDAELSIRREIQRATVDALEAHKDEKKALEEQIDSTRKYINLQRGLAAALVAVADVTAFPATLARAAKEGKSFGDIIADDARSLNSAFDAMTGLESGVAAANQQLQTYNKSGQDQVAILKETGDALLDTERKTRGAEAATQAHEDAIKATEEALRTSIEAMDESNATTQQYSATLAQIAQITDDYQTSLLTGQDAIEAARAKEQASLLAVYQQTVALAQSNAELAAANEAYTEARAAVDAKYAAQSKAYADEQAAKLAENHAFALELQAQETDGLASALEHRAQLWQGFYDGYVATYMDAAMQIADLASQFAEDEYQQHADALDRLQERRDALTDQQKENAQAAQEATDAQTRSELEAANTILAAKKDALREQAKEERQQAMKAFRINQAIQIAQSVAGAALAVLNAFATVPYPASIAAAAAATATGAATIATVAAQKPQFHQGGIVQANVLPGEGVANRDLVRAVGEQTFNAMNRDPAGTAAALSGGGTTLIIGRQAFGEIGRNLLVGRTPVAQAINSRARPGQVALGTSNLPVLS